MTLAELRKLAIKRHYQIHFKLRNGMECIISDHGVAHVPQLQVLPDFNLEEELVHATEFLIEPAVVANAKTPAKNAERPRKISREELASLAAMSPAAAVVADHEDE